jgi:hypothetical protein
VIQRPSRDDLALGTKQWRAVRRGPTYGQGFGARPGELGSGDYVALDTETGTTFIVMPSGAQANQSPSTNQVAYTALVTGR